VFLEFANFNKQFVQYYAKIIRALTKLLKDNKQKKQNKSFIFNKNVIIVFKKLIIVFTRTFILVHFNLKNYICVKTNVLEFVIVVIFF